MRERAPTRSREPVVRDVAAVELDASADEDASRWGQTYLGEVGWARSAARQRRRGFGDSQNGGGANIDGSCDAVVGDDFGCRNRGITPNP